MLALADGTTFVGRAFGARGIATGEVVFTTAMSGYQEVLTDPSYAGQIVTMTAPQIGNTGINNQDPESMDDRPQVAGFVIREESPVVSNYRSQETLDAYLARNGIIEYRIVESTGATEAAPVSGTADFIVDITSSGSTLAANGLRVLEDGLILRSEAHFYVSRAAEWSPMRKAQLEAMMSLLGWVGPGVTTKL